VEPDASRVVVDDDVAPLLVLIEVGGVGQRDGQGGVIGRRGGDEAAP
jgi:hypothetical protein